MAVDATYMNLLPSQLLSNREIIRANNLLLQLQQQQQQNQPSNSAMYNAQMNNSSAMAPQPPATTTTTAATTLIPNTQQSLIMPFYQSSNVCDPNKSDSGLTYHHNNNIPLQRKRSRDFTSEFTPLPPQQKNKLSNPQQQTFINNQDALFQFQNQTQSEIDLVLAHHTEKVRMELEEQKIRQSRVLLSVLQDTMAKKLKEKDEEIQRMEKLNMALQERVKTLCVENQVWRELAQTNETTANYLRSNLEQVLAHVGEERNGGAVLVADDAESCCESNDVGGGGRGGGAAEAEGDTAATSTRMCRSCGVRESIVLLLPCRHLCLCTICGSTIRNCPVCHSGMDASLHVNLA